MRNKFLNEVGSNLSKAMEDRGIKSAQKLSDMMGGNDNTRNINNHRGGSVQMKISQLDEYCAFFGCSADYLLGYIPEETHELTDIAEATGLSKGAIECLKEMNEESKAVLNFLLEYDDALWVLLENMSRYEIAYKNCISTLKNFLDHPHETDAEVEYANANVILNASKGNMREYCDMIIREWEDHVKSK